MKKREGHARSPPAIVAAATIFMLAIMTVSIMATPVVANTITTTTSPEEAGMIELSPRPVYQEQIRDTGQTPINQTHLQITYAGSGTLNLPNGTETIRTASSGSGIASMIDNDFAGQEILTIEDGSESATARVYELLRFDMQQGNGRGITIVTFHTNSTGMLAQLDGMILTGITELHPNGTGSVTLWEWQSGILLSTTPQEPPLTNTTTTTTKTAEGEGETTEEEAVGGAEVAQ